MPLREFSRMTSRLLAHLGEEAVLRGEVVTPPRKIAIEHGVEFADQQNEAIFNRSVATLPKSYMPARGDSILFTDGGSYFILDALLKDDGYSEDWTVRGEPPPP